MDLKFDEMKYLIHYVKFKMCLNLCNFFLFPQFPYLDFSLIYKMIENQNIWLLL